MFRKYEVNLSKFVDCDVYERTLRIEGRISRDEALRRLSVAGVQLKDIEGMYREGDNSPWNAVLNTKEMAEGVNVDGIKYLARMIVDLRVHWLPLYINDDIIKQVLGPFGKVLEITRDKTMIDKDSLTLNGTRLVKLKTTEFDSRHIPHIVSLGQCGMLITMKGRPPVCLKCRQEGHLRKDCPEKSATYASVTTRRNQPTQQSIPVPEVPATPVPQVSEAVNSQQLTPTVAEVEPTTALSKTDPPELNREGIESITSETIPKTTEEQMQRTELFDVDSLSWQVVKRKKRVKSSSTDEEDDNMDISVLK